jgi:hypothetical protein
MRIIMTTAGFSQAVESCRAKYDGAFRVPAHSNAQPLDHTASALQTRHAQYQHGSGPKERGNLAHGSELELELVHTQMAQKPMLRAKVYARALRASQNVMRAEVRGTRDAPDG